MFPEKHTAFIFPGQGSQYLGMGKDLAEFSSLARRAFLEADDLLKLNLSKISWEGPFELLNDTINTQPALLTHSYAALLVFQNLYPGFKPNFVAGHSLGEISALIASDTITFPDAIMLVRQRGVLMKQAGEENPGGMAAVIGMDNEALDMICKKASDSQNSVQIANDNCPGQIVISGSKIALNKAIDIAKSKGAKRVIPLNVSIASHCESMKNAQGKFSQFVDQISMNPPLVPIIGNVNAKPLYSVNDIKQDIHAQLTSRVRWTESVQYMINNGILYFIEMGSGSVLSGLIKRIDSSATTLSFGKPEDIAGLSKH